MKRTPMAKQACARPDCDQPRRQWGFCVNHAALFRRNGVPYRQDEIEDMPDDSRTPIPRQTKQETPYTREMDRLLAAEPPVIQWVFCQRRRVMVAKAVHDPHTKNPRRVA